MMDVSKTVRAKALMLAADILAYRPTEGSSRSAPGAITAVKLQAVQAWMPVLCELLGARRDSQLFDEGCLQVGGCVADAAQ